MSLLGGKINNGKTFYQRYSWFSDTSNNIIYTPFFVLPGSCICHNVRLGLLYHFPVAAAYENVRDEPGIYILKPV